MLNSEMKLEYNAFIFNTSHSFKWYCSYKHLRAYLFIRDVDRVTNFCSLLDSFSKKMAAELVNAATSEKLPEMDWMKNIQICELVAGDHR